MKCCALKTKTESGKSITTKAELVDWVNTNKFISRKYSGTCLLASSTTDIVSFNHDTEVSSKFLLGEKVSQSSDIFGFVTDVNPTFNRITLNSVQGTFTNGSTVTGVDSNKSFTVSSVVREQDVVNHYLDSNNLKTTSSTDTTPVSNEEHERNINEDKHLIRYIEPQYAGRVVREFKKLVRE